VWMDPQLWQAVVTAARDALIQVDPAGKATYERNATRYADQINAMDKRVKARLNAVPATRRVLVTAHDAFRYFGRANGYEVLGIQGISTESGQSIRRGLHLVHSFSNGPADVPLSQSAILTDLGKARLLMLTSCCHFLG